MSKNITNLPDFFVDDEDDKKSSSDSFLGEDLNESLFQNINEEHPLTPVFQGSNPNEATLELCQKEIDRIRNNAKSMSPEELIKKSQPDIVNAILKEFTNYSLVDLDNLPESELNKVYALVSKELKTYYFEIINAEMLLASLKNKYEEFKTIQDIEDEVNELSLNNIEDILKSVGDFDIRDITSSFDTFMNTVLDKCAENIDGAQENAKEILSISGYSKEFINAFITIMNEQGPIIPNFYEANTFDVLTENNMDKTFFDKMQEDVPCKTMSVLKKPFYGKSSLGSKCPSPQNFNNELPTLGISINDIEEETGNVTLVFYQERLLNNENIEILDYEDLVELLGSNFEKWVKKWKVEPIIDMLCLSTKYENLMEKYNSDPISDFAQFANVVYVPDFSLSIQLTLETDYNDLAQTQITEIIDSVEQAISSVTKNQPVQSENKKQEKEEITVVDILDTLDNKQKLRTSFVPKEDKNYNFNLLTKKPEFEIYYSEQAPISSENNLSNLFLKTFLTCEDIFEKAVIYLPHETFKFKKDSLVSFNLLPNANNKNMLLINLQINDGSKFIGVMTKCQDNWNLFFPELFNTFYIENDQVYYNVDENIDGVLIHAMTIAKNINDPVYTLNKLGLFRSFLSKNTIEQPKNTLYKIGTLYLSNTSIANDFVKMNEINKKDIPIYVKIPSVFDKESGFMLGDFLLATGLNQSELILNAPLYYKENYAYIDCDLVPILKFLYDEE